MIQRGRRPNIVRRVALLASEALFISLLVACAGIPTVQLSTNPPAVPTTPALTSVPTATAAPTSAPTAMPAPTSAPSATPPPTTAATASPATPAMDAIKTVI